MSFEYIVEDELKPVSKPVADEIAKNIVDEYTKYDEARSGNLSKSNDIINEIFFKKSYSNISDKNERWKSKIKMCKCYMFYQTLKAFIWKNIYSNVHSMFDVSGENHDSDNQSNKQKAMLVDMLEKMDYQKTCDAVIDNALLYGELISFTAWKKKYQEYRRPIEFFKNLFSKDFRKLPNILKSAKEGQKYWVDTKKIYDNPYIYPVSPADIVFDVTQTDNWDSCPKIYRTFKTPDDIINNKLYSIDKETAYNIKQLIKSDTPNQVRPQDKNNLKEEIVNGSTVEVLEHWGDLKLPSGEVVKNWHAVVVARKYLVKFQKNDYILNPFTYGALVTDPETKRGISPLYCVLALANSQEVFFNKTVDMQALSENPPLLAPEGFFDEEEISLYPGKIIEYGDNLSSISAFKQLTFNTNIFLDNIEFLDSLMCEVSGIYPSMIGIQENSTKTATEINTKTQGQLTRLSLMLDTINQYFILPDIKNIAKLAADFKHGAETIYVNHDNKQETIIIDDSIRQADYKYMYSDRNVINEKSASADLVIQAVDKFAQHIPLDLPEIFVWYFEQKGVENPERFLDQERLTSQNQAQTQNQTNGQTLGQTPNGIPSQISSQISSQIQLPINQDKNTEQQAQIPEELQTAPVQQSQQAQVKRTDNQQNNLPEELESVLKQQAQNKNVPQKQALEGLIQPPGQDNNIQQQNPLIMLLLLAALVKQGADKQGTQPQRQTPEQLQAVLSQLAQLQDKNGQQEKIPDEKLRDFLKIVILKALSDKMSQS